MRKNIVLVLALVCVLGLVSCGQEESLRVGDVGMQYFFAAKVVEVHEEYLLLEVFDTGNTKLSEGAIVEVSTAVTEGTVLEINETNILINESGYEYGECYLTISDDTVIYVDGEKSDISMIEVGKTIKAVYTGGIEEIYPSRINEVIEIIAEYPSGTEGNLAADDDLLDKVEAAIMERLPVAESFEPYHSIRGRRYSYYRIYVDNYII